MIKELSIQNFLSFKKKTTFSFEAVKGRDYVPGQVVEVSPGVNLLRFAAVLGPNASGKSNLIEALSFLGYFPFQVPEAIDSGTNVVAFLLDNEMCSKPSILNLVFYAEDIKYEYHIELNEHKVLLESLFYSPKGRRAKLFERTDKADTSSMNISFNEAMFNISRVAKDELMVKCFPNMSVFAARKKVNILVPEIDCAINWMKEHMLPVVQTGVQLFSFAEEVFQKNTDAKPYFLDFLQKADFNISDIKMSEMINKIPKDKINEILTNANIPEDRKKEIREKESIKSDVVDFVHVVKNGKKLSKYSLPFYMQSVGTMRVMGIEAVLYEAIKRNAFVAVDEIENSLHPDLLIYVLQRFLSEKNSRSQLLVSTHYDPILSEVDELIRKDSIWFTEKDKSGSTSLYSLVDFKGLGRLSSIRDAYINGRFGAKPNIR